MTPALYSPARARQLRALLWVGVVVASVFGAVAAWALVAGATRYGFFLAVPAVLLLLTAGRTLQVLGARGRAARIGSVVTGVLLVLIGLLLASAAVGILPSIVGVLLLLLALLPDVGER